jgi:hypothetical protein
MEEQRRVQESEIGRNTSGEGNQQNLPANTDTPSIKLPSITFLVNEISFDRYCHRF